MIDTRVLVITVIAHTRHTDRSSHPGPIFPETGLLSSRKGQRRKHLVIRTEHSGTLSRWLCCVRHALFAQALSFCRCFSLFCLTVSTKLSRSPAVLVFIETFCHPHPIRRHVQQQHVPVGCERSAPVHLIGLAQVVSEPHFPDLHTPSGGALRTKNDHPL